MIVTLRSAAGALIGQREAPSPEDATTAAAQLCVAQRRLNVGDVLTVHRPAPSGAAIVQQNHREAE